MMDGKTWLGTFLLTATCITGIKTEPILYIDGCISNKNPGVTNVTLRTELPNNYPGTCYSYCRTQKATQSNGSYLALQGKQCLCGEHFTAVNWSPGIDCHDRCPGHSDHYCGQQNTTFSVYKIDTHSQVGNKHVCMAVDCTSTSKRPYGVYCSTKYYTHCVFEYQNCDLQGKSCGSAKVPWNMPSNECHNYDRMRFYSNRCQTCNACSTHKEYWIGAFAVWAPPKTCANLSKIDNGSWSFTKDDETVEYHCIAGFTLKGSQTRYCMHDGSWTGNQPYCAPDMTVTTNYLSSTTSASTITSEELPSSSFSSPITTTLTVTGSTSTQSHPVTVSNTTQSPSVTGKGGLSAGAIAGIGVGVLIFCGLVIGIGILVWYFKKKRGRQYANEETDSIKPGDSQFSKNENLSENSAQNGVMVHGHDQEESFIDNGSETVPLQKENVPNNKTPLNLGQEESSMNIGSDEVHSQINTVDSSVTEHPFIGQAEQFPSQENIYAINSVENRLGQEDCNYRIITISQDSGTDTIPEQEHKIQNEQFENPNMQTEYTTLTTRSINIETGQSGVDETRGTTKVHL